MGGHVKLINCPRCGQETEIRDLRTRKFSAPGPRLRTKDGWTPGVVCDCGYLAYGHMLGDRFVIDRETEA